MKEVKLIIAGGRDFSNYAAVERAMSRILEAGKPDEHFSIVSGMARGADALGVHYARENNAWLYQFPANWDKYGKRAGIERNKEMGYFSDHLLAFWDGKSRGTHHMITFMYDLRKPVTVINY